MNDRERFNRVGQIFGGQTAPQKQQPKETDIIEYHHRFMVIYGWIPLSEFRELSQKTFWNLAQKVDEEYRKKEEFRLYTLRYYGVKNPT